MCSMVTFISCDDDDDSLPKIDGYNNSDEVAADYLVAKWALDGNAKESISGEAGEESNVTYVDGKVGEAASFDEGYIYTEEVPNMATKITTSFSISLSRDTRINFLKTSRFAAVLGILTEIFKFWRRVSTLWCTQEGKIFKIFNVKIKVG